MGLFSMFSGLFGSGGKSAKARILCVGLDNSGKSTIINFFKPKKSATGDVVPTVGFSVDEFTRNGLTFTVFDMSGQGRYRNLWEHYYKEVGGIIFCIDSTDKLRMCVAKDELESLLAHAEIKEGVPVLFFANKMDLPTAVTPVECVQALQLDAIIDKPWHIAASNGLTGHGLEEGIAWLAEAMARFKRRQT